MALQQVTVFVQNRKGTIVSVTDILSNRRTASLVLARQVAMYIARETTDLSYKAIGESFGKDHSTVLYNVSKIEKIVNYINGSYR